MQDRTPFSFQCATAPCRRHYAARLLVVTMTAESSSARRVSTCTLSRNSLSFIKEARPACCGTVDTCTPRAGGRRNLTNRGQGARDGDGRYSNFFTCRCTLRLCKSVVQRAGPPGMLPSRPRHQASSDIIGVPFSPKRRLSRSPRAAQRPLKHLMAWGLARKGQFLGVPPHPPKADQQSWVSNEILFPPRRELS